eukprot:1140557-Pelagomonas_calceolata.AAC.1
MQCFQHERLRVTHLSRAKKIEVEQDCCRRVRVVFEVFGCCVGFPGDYGFGSTLAGACDPAACEVIPLVLMDFLVLVIPGISDWKRETLEKDGAKASHGLVSLLYKTMALFMPVR